MTMNFAQQQRPGLLAAALARAEAWLLEPVAPAPVVARPVELPARPMVAVIGLAARAGATTVARGLAARLACGDPSGASIVVGSAEVPPFAPATRSAARLASRIGSAAAGRLCLVEGADYTALAESPWRHAPLVLDVNRDEASGAASLADLVILVAPGDGEPALAELAARSLGCRGGEPLVVVSRPEEGSRWDARAAVELPASRTGARLAAAGWEPRGALGDSVARLAELCHAAVRA